MPLYCTHRPSRPARPRIIHGIPCPFTTTFLMGLCSTGKAQSCSPQKSLCLNQGYEPHRGAGARARGPVGALAAFAASRDKRQRSTVGSLSYHCTGRARMTCPCGLTPIAVLSLDDPGTIAAAARLPVVLGGVDKIMDYANLVLGLRDPDPSALPRAGLGRRGDRV